VLNPFARFKNRNIVLFVQVVGTVCVHGLLFNNRLFTF
jgi:hypothetical protein